MEYKPVDPATYPMDKVTLFQLPRGPWAPSMSPFALKLETFLRMAKLPYQNDFSNPMGPKGKCPWLIHEGKIVCDSQLCIEYFAKHHAVDLNSHLNAEQRAVARSMEIMVDEHLFWVVEMWRFDYLWEDPDYSKFAHMALGPVTDALPGIVLPQAQGQGMARHTKEEVTEIGERTIRALSDYLGDKQYIMGDQPCDADSAIFGQLAQCVWHIPGSPLEKLVKGDCKNIAAYCERIMTRFWPDWDQCITHGGKKEAAAK